MLAYFVYASMCSLSAFIHIVELDMDTQLRPV